LNEKGAYSWDDFRGRLLEQVAGGGPSYYESWLSALEGLLRSRGIVTQEEIERRAGEYLALERDPVF
jgi:hypothetical protein